MHDILRLIWHTGLVAKIVLIILFFLSTISWAIIFQKLAVIFRMNRQSKRFLNQYKNRTSWGDLFKSSREFTQSPRAQVFMKGFQEVYYWKKQEDHPLPDPLIRRESLVHVMESSAAEEMGRLERFLPMLSTCVSISPFLGLFGTVWGVMEAFLSIGMKGAADITTVGPGIAEALITTVVGLFVAIPALAAYNLFVARFRKLEEALDVFIADFARMVERGWSQ